MSLSQVTAWTPGPDGAFTGTIDASWSQGRTAFGGVVTAGAWRALSTVDPDRRLVDIHTRYVAPLPPGPVRCTVEVLRRGRSVTHVRAQVHHSNGLAALVDATLAAPRPSRITVAGDGRPAGLPDPAALPSVPHIPGSTPAFLQHVDLRWTTGGPPASGHTEARIGGWCRLREPPTNPATTALALLDAWPSPVLSLLTRPAPASTIAWTAWVHHLPATSDGWWWYTEHGTHVEDGIATSVGRLMAPDGRLAATRAQSVAIYA